MAHASKDVHCIINDGNGVTLSASGQRSKGGNGRPFVSLRTVAPDVVVEILVVCSSETIDG